jgi:hypothetical protein
MPSAKTSRIEIGHTSHDLDAGTKIALKRKKSGDFERFLLPQDTSASWGYFLTLKFFEIL